MCITALCYPQGLVSLQSIADRKLLAGYYNHCNDHLIISFTQPFVCGANELLILQATFSMLPQASGCQLVVLLNLKVIMLDWHL